MDRRNRFCFRPQFEVLEGRALPNNFFSPGSGLGPDLVALIHRHEKDLLMAASNRFKPLVIPGNGPNPGRGLRGGSRAGISPLRRELRVRPRPPRAETRRPKAGARRAEVPETAGRRPRTSGAAASPR